MNPDLQNLEKKIIETLEEAKAEEIISLNVNHLTSITDKILICTGTSKRHSHAIAEHVISAAKKMGLQPLGVEGMDSSEWVLIDLGHMIVHVMLSALRQFYSLEKLWSMTQERIESSSRKTS